MKQILKTGLTIVYAFYCSSYQQRPVVSSEAVATGNTKHLKTDVPDPPLELLSGDITASSHGNPSRVSGNSVCADDN